MFVGYMFVRCLSGICLLGVCRVYVCWGVALQWDSTLGFELRYGNRSDFISIT